MGIDAKKTELVPGTLEMLILKTIERNAGRLIVVAVNFQTPSGPGDQRLGQSGVGLI
ncbi:MAG TPA: hypothetical protein VFY40_09490 [Blastocatellia bacterium]|nr:hypothetical protein [Blastocatellia bacterium]